MKKSFPLIFTIIIVYILSPLSLSAQVKPDSTSTAIISLSQCISFALKNQPATKQANIDEEINEKNIDIALADWLPQISSTGNATHYFQLPVAPFQGALIPSGIVNTSVIGLQGTQVIYNPTVALAARTSKYSRQYYQQNTVSTQINVVSDVSKAFYDVLLSERQLSIINEDILRLQRSLKDAYAQYQAGLVDKIDYKQATISLNNSVAGKKQAEEAIKSKIAFLKQVMGVAPEKPIQLAYDSVKLELETTIDTTQILDVNNRIEYKQLQTQKTLDNINVDYYRWQYLPSVSAFGNYNFDYFNQNLPDLYGKAYPTSSVGLSFSIPIFQGNKRLKNVSKAKLQVDRLDLDIENTRNSINTEYVQSLANYKSSYKDYQELKENVALAKDVYNVVFVQYREGIKTYLNVITAESDLRTSELNYYNALFTVLSSKIDLQKALGTLSTQY